MPGSPQTTPKRDKRFEFAHEQGHTSVNWARHRSIYASLLSHPAMRITGAKELWICVRTLGGTGYANGIEDSWDIASEGTSVA